MKKGKNAQMSMEYMIVMGFALLLTVPLTVVFFQQSAAASDQVNAGKAAQIARQIIDTSEQVYYLGEPTMTSLKVSMPDTVSKVILTSNDLTIRLKTGSGETDIVVASSVNLTGNISEAGGIQTILIRAIPHAVNITSST